MGLFLATLLPITSFAALDSNLKYGSTGTSVTELQEFLTTQGVYSGPITGNFYALTLAAVKAYQTKESIQPVSGYWGSISRAKAQSELNISASDTDEENQTGTITNPTAPNSDMQAFITAYQVAMAKLQTQTQAQTQAVQQVAASTQQIAQNTTPATTPILEITDVDVESVHDSDSGTQTKERITWSTSIPTNGKVTYNANSQNYGDPLNHVVQSMSGLSTNHVVYISDYSSNPGVTYNYVIEATSSDGLLDSTYNGSHTIPSPPSYNNEKISSLRNQYNQDIINSSAYANYSLYKNNTVQQLNDLLTAPGLIGTNNSDQNLIGIILDMRSIEAQVQTLGGTL